MDDVLTVAARDEIAVAAALTHQKVIAAPAFQHIRAAPTLKGVVTVQPKEVTARLQPGCGRPGGRDDHIVARRRGQRPCKRSDIQNGAIAELQTADQGRGLAQGLHERDPVIPARDQQDQIAIGIPLQADIRNGNAQPEPDDAQSVGIAGRFDPVLPVAPVEHIDIRPATIADNVVANPRQVGFRPGCPVQHIVACGSDRVDLIQQRVERPDGAIAEDHFLDRAIADHEGIVGQLECQDQVVPAVGHAFDPHIGWSEANEFQPVEAARVLDHILPVAAGEAIGIVARAAAQNIGAGSAFQRIGPATAPDQIVAGAGLGFHPCRNQVGGTPSDRVCKDDFRHGAGACGPHQNDLVARFGEGQDQVGAIARGLSHHRLLRVVVGNFDPRDGRSGQHLHPVHPVAGAEDHCPVLPQQDAILSGAGVHQEARIEIAGIVCLLRCVRGIFAQDATHICDGQGRVILELEQLHRGCIISPDDRDDLVRGRDADQQVGAALLESHIVARDPGAEDQTVEARTVENPCAAIRIAEMIGVIARAPFQRISPRAARQRIIAVVEPDQPLIGIGSRQHAVDDVVDGQDGPIAEAEFLHPSIAEAPDDGQHIRPVAKIDDQIVALPRNAQRILGHRSAELHPVDHAGRIRAFLDPVKIIARPEGIGIGRRPPDQRVIALPSVQHIGRGRVALDQVVAPVTAFDAQQLLHIGDRQETAIHGEVEPLHPVVEVKKLVADAQRIRGAIDGDQQIVAVLGEGDIIPPDPCAEAHDIILRHDDAGPVVPCGAHAGVDDQILTITNVEQIGIAAIAADQRVIAAAPVQRFGEIRPGDQLARRRADKVDVFRVEIGEFQHAIFKGEFFDRELLAVVADELVFQHDLVWRAVDRDDQIQRRP